MMGVRVRCHGDAPRWIMSSGIADIVPASSEPRLCQQSRPPIDLQCASRSRHATVVLAACMSPAYHQAREQLRPESSSGPTTRSASTVCFIAQIFRAKEDQSSNVTGRRVLQGQELTSYPSDPSGVASPTRFRCVEWKHEHGLLFKLSTLPHLPTCPLFLQSSDSQRNSQAKELPSTVREGPACLASRCQRWRISGPRVGRWRWSGEPAKLGGCGDSGMNQVLRLCHWPG